MNIVWYVVFALELVGPREGRLKSHAIASSIQSLRVYALRVKKAYRSKVVMHTSCLQLQGQATCGKNTFSIE